MATNSHSLISLSKSTNAIIELIIYFNVLFPSQSWISNNDWQRYSSDRLHDGRSRPVHLALIYDDFLLHLLNLIEILIDV